LFYSMILIVKHIEIEGPGTIEKFFNRRSRQSVTVNMSLGECLPAIRDDLEAVIFLGGPMNVYEEDTYPFLCDEDKFLKRALELEIPVLGICLGAQLLAKACGAQVTRAPVKEIGWNNVRLTSEGCKDLLFNKLSSELEVFQWHEDTFAVPPGGVLLAESAMCKNQAFRIGKNAYGLQFHVEITPEIVGSWIREYVSGPDSGIDTGGMLRRAYEVEKEYQQRCRIMCFNFFKIIRSLSRSAHG